MKIRINDKALLKEIAEVCYDNLCTDLGSGRTMYGLLHDLIEEKVAKLIEENKDTILDRAASMVADDASIKKALSMMGVELSMTEE